MSKHGPVERFLSLEICTGFTKKHKPDTNLIPQVVTLSKPKIKTGSKDSRRPVQVEHTKNLIFILFLT